MKMRIIIRTEVESTVIEAIKYENNLLIVYFLGGQIYVYSGVSNSVYEGFLEAESKGRYFRQNVMGRYQSTRVL